MDNENIGLLVAKPLINLLKNRKSNIEKGDWSEGFLVNLQMKWELNRKNTGYKNRKKKGAIRAKN